MAGLDLGQVRALFAQEAAVRLSRLGNQLLTLEQTSGDRELVDSVFRELHTLKGSSAVAGFDDVSKIAHDLEEFVDAMRDSPDAVTAEAIDVLLSGVDRLNAAIEAGVGPLEPGPDARPDTMPGPRAEEPSRSDPAPAPRTESDGSGVVMVPMERLDELVRLVGESASAHLRVGRMLQERFRIDPASCAEYTKLSRSLNDLQDRTMRTRMVPVATMTDQMHRAARDVARARNKDIRWEVRGADTELDRGVLHRLSEALLHLVRNAVDHGIESAAEREAKGKPRQGLIRLHAMQLGSEVIIAVSDDGAGVDTERVREQAARQGVDVEQMTAEDLCGLIFRSRLSTAAFVTDISGRGVGLDAVRTAVEAVSGRVEVRSERGVGTEFRVIVPITLAVLRCLLVEAGGQRFAIPFHRVITSRRYDASVVTRAEGRPVVWVDQRPVRVSRLADTLAMSQEDTSDGPVVVLGDTADSHAFQVDRLVGRRDVVLKGLGPPAPHLPVVAGASVEPDGSILIVLDPPGLIRRARRATGTDVVPVPAGRHSARRHQVMVVDDALTVRELQRSILERAGYEVRVAGDGAQALSSLRQQPCDLVLTDVEMPNMDGFALTEAIRSTPALANVPVLMLTSRAGDSDRQRGLDAGADGYILKSGFDEGSLLTAVNRLLGGTP
jgi:two-component system, chemotaxis family, sensor kinase CheA